MSKGLAQTDGPPPPQPPGPVLLAGQAPAGLWDGLVADVSERGYRLLRGPANQLGGANGVTKITEREVWVRDDVDDAQAAKTLTHELAHTVHLEEARGLWALGRAVLGRAPYLFPNAFAMSA